VFGDTAAASILFFRALVPARHWEREAERSFDCRKLQRQLVRLGLLRMTAVSRLEHIPRAIQSIDFRFPLVEPASVTYTPGVNAALIRSGSTRRSKTQGRSWAEWKHAESLSSV